ncbi:major facilitator superfamily domain-containing protein [Parasitella parasitica]|nr:major facilitator superfamily domain-containing protein [Parasitella parasitica]
MDEVFSEPDSTQISLTKSVEELKFVKKLNWTVLPIIFLIIFIQFCDKSALSVAAVLGIMEDANLAGDQFSWLGSIFYLGYFVVQLPNNYLIQRLPISKYLGTILIFGGCVMGATAACSNFAQLLGLRFLLGFFEGVTYPCIYILLNTLYRRSEQGFCWGFLGVSNGLGTVFGVLISYGLAHMDHLIFRAWRWGYIVFGSATVVIGIATFFLLVDDVDSKLLRLTDNEKEIVQERSRDNCVVRNKEIKKAHVIEALQEPRLYLIFFAQLFNCLQNGGLITFSTLLVEGLGFSPFMAIILQIPNGIAACIFAMTAVFLADKYKRIAFTGIFMSCVSLLGCILMAAIPGAPKLLGFYLSWAMAGVAAILQTLISNNVSGYTKKIFYNGVNMLAMTIGNFVGPLMMTANTAPTYWGAMVGFSVSNVLIICCVYTMYIIMSNENKRRFAEPPSEKYDVQLDLTDVQDKNILYKL